MKLDPSQRQKKRYILFQLLTQKEFSLKDVNQTINKALKDFLGDYGLSKASPLFLKETYEFPYFIIKVNHKYTDHIKTAIILNKTIKNTPVLIRSISTSGTLKTIKRRKEETKENE